MYTLFVLNDLGYLYQSIVLNVLGYLYQFTGLEKLLDGCRGSGKAYPSRAPSVTSIIVEVLCHSIYLFVVFC